MKSMRFFITGTAGFIGFHLAKRLLSEGHQVVGFDAMTPYYDVRLKERRRSILLSQDRYTHFNGSLEDKKSLAEAFSHIEADVVVHLAAQAGVRYSLENPDSYVNSNLIGTYNILECCRSSPPQHLLLASTSSVYGGNEERPFFENSRTDFPVSLYAATKKGGEALAHAYAHLFSIPTTCFRFFTVYGPWGRPDMALFKFVAAIKCGQPIDVYGDGTTQRDYTYVDDLIESIVRLVGCRPSTLGASATTRDSLSPVAPWRTVNIGGGSPVTLAEFIATIERVLGVTAKRNVLPMQPGDVVSTSSDTSLLESLIGYKPSTSIEDGIRSFVEWYDEYYSIMNT